MSYWTKKKTNWSFLSGPREGCLWLDLKSMIWAIQPRKLSLNSNIHSFMKLLSWWQHLLSIRDIIPFYVIWFLHFSALFWRLLPHCVPATSNITSDIIQIWSEFRINLHSNEKKFNFLRNSLIFHCKYFHFILVLALLGMGSFEYSWSDIGSRENWKHFSCSCGNDFSISAKNVSG